MRIVILALLLVFVDGLAAQDTPSGTTSTFGQKPSAQSSPTGPQSSPAIEAPPSSATQPTASTTAAPPTIRATSRIVVLDAVVLDKKGNVVTGLKREDFHVSEENQPQQLIAFEEAGAHTPSQDISTNSTEELDRLAPRAPVNIILLDEFSTRFEDMAFARYSLKKYLERQPGKLSMPTMLLAVSLQNFTVLHDYTQDKNAILTALDKHFAAYPWQVHQYSWLAERYSTAFGTLMRVAEATEGHRGHKNMIWIGRGFPSLNLVNIPVDSRTRLDNVVQQCVNMLRDARVTLYTIDPAGVMIDPSQYGSEAAAFEPFGGNYQFNRLATATGGRTFYGRNDVDAEIGTSLRDGAAFYTLVYRPTGTTDQPHQFRHIKVTFDNPDLHAVTRTGYYPARGPYRVDPEHPTQRLAFDLGAATDSTMVYDGVPVSVVRDPAGPDHFVVHIDHKGLNWSAATDADPRRAELIIVAVSFDAKGKELQRVAKDVTVPAPRDLPATGRIERNIDLKISLPHDPRAVRARFVVRVASTGRIGTADSTLGPVAAQADPPSANLPNRPPSQPN